MIKELMSLKKEWLGLTDDAVCRIIMSVKLKKKTIKQLRAVLIVV